MHDIEDLVKAGRRRTACPYYAARTLAENADIVFCPYNYLIDPQIRKSVSIELRNAVVIFDEAHNIEDVARDAASVDITKQYLEEAFKDAGCVHLLLFTVPATCPSVEQWLDLQWTVQWRRTRANMSTSLASFRQPCSA